MFGLVANVLSDRVLRTGAKVWITRCNGDAECPVVYGLSKSGRMTRKFTKYKRLTNFRVAWIPEHLREDVHWYWDTREEAQVIADNLKGIWTGVRFFNRDGTKLKHEGVSVDEAFKHWMASVKQSSPIL